MTCDQPNVPLCHNYYFSKYDNQSIVQWKVAPLETKSTTVYDAGFTMIAMIPKFKLTVWSIDMMFDDNNLDKCVRVCEPNYNAIKN